MPLTEMVVTIAIAAAMVLGFIALLRLFSTIITHRTIRSAVEKNPELAEQLLDRLTARGAGRPNDILPIVLIAIGIAMAVAPLIAVDDPGIVRFAVGAALFPLLVGGALWLRLRSAERARQRDQGE